jgi:hypothetical protein
VHSSSPSVLVGPPGPALEASAAATRSRGLRLRAGAAAIALIAAGLLLRVSTGLQASLWVDEAESSINALTILDQGYPGDHYMGLPLYENTLIEPWDGHHEYEFRDSSYRPNGLAVYHGWLPLYSIAAAQRLLGIQPDRAPAAPVVRHQDETIKRVLVPRLPALLFSALFLACLFRLAGEAAGPPAAFATLTWAALSERSVLFGYPARYYSATLCFTTLAAWMLWRATHRGKWRDFVFLGLAEALLFHTHHVSALVFGGVIVCTAPWWSRTAQGWRKGALALAVAGALTLPWAWWTGFFSTAATVPKVVRLFEGPEDWLRFAALRPSSLILFAASVAVLALGRSRLVRSLPRLAAPLQRITPIAAPLIAWVLLAYLAVHLIVPAASFFPNRLSLMMQVPGVLLVGCAIGVVAQALHPGRAAVIAGALTLALLLGTGKLADWRGLSLDESRFAHPVATALSTRTFPVDTRLYASPNDQLIFQYLYGLPVQSVAPIRRSFFETHPGPILFIEARYGVSPDLEDRIRQAAESEGIEPTPEQLRAWRRALWEQHVIADLSRRALPRPPAPQLPAFLAPVADQLHQDDAAYVAATKRRMPLFRSVEVATPGELWLSFSYRFVDYPSRLGVHANIYPRLQRSRVELLPDASVVLFHCEPLVQAANAF